jgi:hypothetical protein
MAGQGMSNNSIPEWAKPGASVIFEPGFWGQERTFLKATVTRVTKASVFVKADGSDRERRFVPCHCLSDNQRMMELGGRAPGTYIWNPDYDGITLALEEARVRSLELKVAKAAKDLADEINRHGNRVPSAIDGVRRAIAEYDSACPQCGALGPCPHCGCTALGNEHEHQQ